MAPRGITVGFVSLGCPKNTVDTEEMMGHLTCDGYELVADAELADVLVVNTCGFIAGARKEAVETILEMAGHKSGRCRVLAVTGCLAQRYGAELAEEIPEIDVLLGVDCWKSLPRAIEEALAGARVVAVTGPPRYDLATRPPRVVTTPQSAAYLRIADGCDHRCRYCAIPSIRGPFASRPLDPLLREAQALAAGGVRELTLVAQDTTAYGKDLPGRPTLVGLLTELSGIESLRWLRVLYMYPAGLDRATLESLAAVPKFVPYFDLPVQHGSARVLRAMGRPEEPGALLRTTERIREVFPAACLRASLMVGYPGEQAADFDGLLDFLTHARFDRAGVFRFSPEEGTPAHDLPDQVLPRIKATRFRRAMRVQARLALRENLTWIGRRLTVLLERAAPVPQGPAGAASKTSAVSWVGRSFREAADIDGKVVVLAPPATAFQPGTFVTVTVIAVGPHDTLAVYEPGDCVPTSAK